MTSAGSRELTLPKLGTKARVLVVAAPFLPDVTAMLVDGAKSALEAAGVEHSCIEVPGALEIPTAISIASISGQFDGFVALGCVMRGETSHYDLVCDKSAHGLMQLGLKGVCIGNGIMTVESRQQAIERADPNAMNKGGEAAAAALHLLSIRERFGGNRQTEGFESEWIEDHGIRPSSSTSRDR